VKLFEHPEFEQIIVRTAATSGVSEQFVEKDYYVTEILRIVVAQLADQTIFKGGTSLSKGWKLTTRFSEDVDLFVDPEKFDPPLGKNAVDRTLKRLSEQVAEHPALTWLRDDGHTSGGLAREDYFSYETLFDGLPGIRSSVLLEPGVQSGDFPTEVRPISSLVADFLRDQDRLDMADDLEPFDMTLLHFRRTFVEKLFTIHGKVVQVIEGGGSLGRDARHYADLDVLAGTVEVQGMLNSPEYAEIRDDYDEKSKRFFPKYYRPPAGLSFRDSPALFPPADLHDQLAAQYERECGRLFPGGEFPPFDHVLERFRELRALL
jgi:hypothetical protein